MPHFERIVIPVGKTQHLGCYIGIIVEKCLQVSGQLRKVRKHHINTVIFPLDFPGQFKYIKMIAVAGRPRNRNFQEPDIGQVQQFLDLFGLLCHPALKSGNDTVPENIIAD